MTASLLFGIVDDLRRCRRRPPRIKPLTRLLGGDSVFHVEAERRRASWCRTDAGASNPRGTWWGVAVNAVPDGSPRRCNASRRLRSVLERGLRHVTAVQEPRSIEKRFDRFSVIARKIQTRFSIQILWWRNLSVVSKLEVLRGDRWLLDYDKKERKDSRVLETGREILKCTLRSL